MPTKKGLFLLFTAAFCYLGAMVFDVSAMLYLSGILLALLAVDFLWLRLSCFGVSCRMEADRTARVGESVRLRFSLRNRWPVTRCGLVVSVPYPAAGTPVDPERLWVRAVPGRSTVRHVLEVPCERRGRFTVGPVSLTYHGLLGLFHQGRSFEEKVELEVQPRCVGLEGFPLLTSGEGFTGAERRRPKPGMGTEFYAVRPYEYGDSPRWVHWLSTLRAQKLMTRQFQAPTRKRAVVVLDCRAGRFALQRGGEAFETAVTVAASLARSAFETDHEVGFLNLGREQEWIAPAAGIENLRQILSLLAGLTHQSGAGSEEDFRRLNAGMESILFVTPSPDLGRARMLAQMRGRRRQIGAVLCDSSEGRPSRRTREVRECLRDAGVEVHRVRSVETMKRELEDLPASRPGGDAPAAGPPQNRSL